VLSLSKHRSSSTIAAEEKQQFDKLSENGRTQSARIMTSP